MHLCHSAQASRAVLLGVPRCALASQWDAPLHQLYTSLSMKTSVCAEWAGVPVLRTRNNVWFHYL